MTSMNLALRAWLVAVLGGSPLSSCGPATPPEPPRPRSLVPAMAPDSTPLWILQDSSRNPRTYNTKNIVMVLFRVGATQAERQVAIDAVGGTVVGGLPEVAGGDGMYYVFIRDDGTEAALHVAIRQLRMFPQVTMANLDLRITEPKGAPDATVPPNTRMQLPGAARRSSAPP